MDEPIYLRALETADLDRCHTWHNDRSLYETLWGAFHFVSRKAATAWLDGKTAFSSEEVNLAMCVRESDRHVGNIYLRQINKVARHAELQIFVGDREERGRGYGQSAVRQLLSYAFDDLGLRRVYLDVLADNHAAIHIYEKCGFEVEATLKDHAFKRGGWLDVIVMGVCVGHEGAPVGAGA